MLQSVGSQRVRHNLATEQQQQQELTQDTLLESSLQTNRNTLWLTMSHSL